MLGVERRTITTNSYVYLIINNEDNNDRCCKISRKKDYVIFLRCSLISLDGAYCSGFGTESIRLYDTRASADHFQMYNYKMSTILSAIVISKISIILATL
jgi:hypothetical protein